MKKFFAEFKEFALKGNVMDMAIGVVIGAAFKAIIDALTEYIINPIIGCFIQGGLEGWTVTIGKAELGLGAFIMAIINFLIIAFILFCVVKTMNKLMNLRKKPEEEAAPLTKKCPFCKSDVDIEAVKCPHCTSDIPEDVA
jgi:large conductance mechanosensitive channel